MLMWWARVVNAVAGMSLAFSATRWSFVETSSELGLPAIFPSGDSVTRCLPSLHGVLSGEFPRFRGPTEAFRLPRVRPGRLGVHLVRRYRSSCGGDTGASQVPGEPPCVHAPLSDPGGIAVPGPSHHCDAAFRSSDGVGSHELIISRLNHAAYTLPVYASRPALPQDSRNTRFWLWTNFTRRGWLPAGLHRKVSVVRLSYTTSSFPRLCLAHQTAKLLSRKLASGSPGAISHSFRRTAPARRSSRRIAGRSCSTGRGFGMRYAVEIVDYI